MTAVSIQCVTQFRARFALIFYARFPRLAQPLFDSAPFSAPRNFLVNPLVEFHAVSFLRSCLTIQSTRPPKLASGFILLSAWRLVISGVSHFHIRGNT